MTTTQTSTATDTVQSPVHDPDFDEPRQPIDKAVLVSFIGYSLFLFAVFLVATLMVYNYWYGEYGRHAVNELKEQLHTQKELNKKQAQTLSRLQADVHDLKTGLVAIEEHARSDLGLIKSGEIFVQLATVGTVPLDMPKPQNTNDAKEALEADTFSITRTE